MTILVQVVTAALDENEYQGSICTRRFKVGEQPVVGVVYHKSSAFTFSNFSSSTLRDSLAQEDFYTISIRFF
jgi:hypothetical protein